MNVPNRLTMARVLLIPLFVLFMCLSVKGGQVEALRAAAGHDFVVRRWISVIIFGVASFTDFLDGNIARKKGLISNFGKFMDPLADKLLVCSALILLSVEGSLPVWVVLIIIAREFIIGGIRQVAADKGTVIAASKWGKLKTCSQMLLCIVLILPTLPVRLGAAVIWVLIIIATALTLISLIDYIIKNKNVMLEGGM
ncbi:MAG: CDP-diacylglycerol--glycerol-3-phosphate 3-phosphatidyltransferase [Lachnospiraceae bacterium]|nr:CDP-diacylglycerol--glycerol-3-phosphate 3-phosphatidyltransferase [Lachnospiraceae bacterium]